MGASGIYCGVPTVDKNLKLIGSTYVYMWYDDANMMHSDVVDRVVNPRAYMWTWVLGGTERYARVPIDKPAFASMGTLDWWICRKESNAKRLLCI